jgi:hypothetical protein
LTNRLDGIYACGYGYVSDVDLWLMGLRGDLLAAMGDIGDDTPLGKETEFMVVLTTWGGLMIEARSEWISSAQGEAVRAVERKVMAMQRTTDKTLCSQAFLERVSHPMPAICTLH